MSSPSSGSGKLGSLAQAARGKQLREARVILYFVGGLTLLLNGFFFFDAESQVQRELDREIAKVRGQGMVVDPGRVAEVRESAVRVTRLVAGGAMGLGLVFIVCGVLVYAHPVPATVTSLVLYIGAAAVFGLLNPSSLTAGLLIKILIVLGLFKAVQAAIAYRKQT